MYWASALAIYLLFWALTAFVVLPFGIRTHDEVGEARVPGQADSAPANFQPLQVIVRTTIVSGILFGLYYANYEAGWITLAEIDFIPRPPDFSGQH